MSILATMLAAASIAALVEAGVAALPNFALNVRQLKEAQQSFRITINTLGLSIIIFVASFVVLLFIQD